MKLCYHCKEPLKWWQQFTHRWEPKSCEYHEKPYIVEGGSWEYQAIGCADCYKVETDTGPYHDFMNADFQVNEWMKKTWFEKNAYGIKYHKDCLEKAIAKTIRQAELIKALKGDR